MDVPGPCSAYGGAILSFLCARTEAGCSCVFGLLLDKRGAMTDDNEVTAPVTSALTPGQGRRRCPRTCADSAVLEFHLNRNQLADSVDSI